MGPGLYLRRCDWLAETGPDDQPLKCRESLLVCVCVCVELARELEIASVWWWFCMAHGGWST